MKSITFCLFEMGCPGSDYGGVSAVSIAAFHRVSPPCATPRCATPRPLRHSSSLRTTSRLFCAAAGGRSALEKLAALCCSGAGQRPCEGRPQCETGA